MIFELKLDCSQSRERLGFLLDRVLRSEEVFYRVFENKDGVYLWIDCTDLATNELERITQKLSNLIPHSLFVSDISSKLLEKQSFPLAKPFSPTPTFSFCPSCIQTPKGTQCVICQKQIPKSYDLSKIVSLLLDGKAIKITTESGEHILNVLCPSCVQEGERIYCLNLEKIFEICNLTSKELQALMSDEKPIVRVRAGANLRVREILICVAHDLQLLELFEILKKKGVDFLSTSTNFCEEFHLCDCIALPQEVLVLENDAPVVLHSSPSLVLQEEFMKYKSLDKAYLATILQENAIREKNILNFYFSLQGGDKVCLYNSQTQWFNEVMSFVLPKDLFTLFEEIAQKDENGEKLLEHYKNTFPHLFENNISFQNFSQGIFGIWEIVRVVLEMPQNPLYIANANLTQRGVAIDYRFKENALIAQEFNVVRCICSGMSFRLAGVAEAIIALGYIESFSLFPSKLYLGIRDSVDIDGMSLCGDLFASKMIGDFFYKNNRQLPIYRNISFPLLYHCK